MSFSSFFLFFVLVFLYFFAFCSGEFVKTIYTAELTPEDVVPSHGPKFALGAAVCVYDRNLSPKTLDCEVQFNIDPVNGPFSAGIFYGGPNDNGPLIYEFTTRIVSNFRQKFSLVTLEVAGIGKYRTEQQEYDFLNGLWYISITSVPYMFGNIRGSLSHNHYIFSRLNNQNVLPPINSTLQPNTTGLAIASFTQYNPRRGAHFTIVHDVDIPIGLGIHRGNSSEAGGRDIQFRSTPNSPIVESVTYVTSTQRFLRKGEQYLQIQSAQFPNGEIRGSLETIDDLPSVSFTARMDSISVIPQTVTVARGCALFSLNCKTLKLEYLIFHSVTTSTNAWMNLGDRYTFGTKLWTLSRAESPIYGSRILTAEEVVAFYKEELYVTIESLVYPRGEIRGQISDRYPYYAYLSGTNIVPPKTTSSLGCATFRLNEETSDGRVFDYDILFSLRKNIGGTVVEFMQGDAGSKGELIHQFDKFSSPASGTNVLINSKQQSLIQSGQTFIQIGESTIFSEIRGEIRGQIQHIINPCPFLTSEPRPPVNGLSTTSYLIPEIIEWNNAVQLQSSLMLWSLFMSFLFFLIF